MQELSAKHVMVEMGVTPLVESARPCVECSYDLQGLPISGNCPECGTPVERSLRGILLEYAGATYVRTLESGLSLVLNGMLGYILVIVAITAGRAVASTQGVTRDAMDAIRAGAGLIVSGVILLGYFRYSAPDPGYLGKEKGNSARQSLRSVVVLQAGMALLDFLLRMGSSMKMSLANMPLLTVVAGTVSMMLWLLQLSVVMNYTAWLAGRIPDPFVIARARRFRWQFPVGAGVCVVLAFFSLCAGLIFGVFGLLMFIRYWTLLNRMRVHMRSIIATGRPADLTPPADGRSPLAT